MKKYNNKKFGYTQEFLFPIIIVGVICFLIFNWLSGARKVNDNEFKFINDLKMIMSYEKFLLSDKDLFKKPFNFDVSVDNFEFISLEQVTSSNDYIKNKLNDVVNNKMENKKEVLDKIISNYKDEIYFLKNKELFITENKNILFLIEDIIRDNKVTNKEFNELLLKLKKYFDLVEEKKNQQKQ